MLQDATHGAASASCSAASTPASESPAPPLAPPLPASPPFPPAPPGDPLPAPELPVPPPPKSPVAGEEPHAARTRKGTTTAKSARNFIGSTLRTRPRGRHAKKCVDGAALDWRRVARACSRASPADPSSGRPCYASAHGARGARAPRRRPGGNLPAHPRGGRGARRGGPGVRGGRGRRPDEADRRADREAAAAPPVIIIHNPRFDRQVEAAQRWLDEHGPPVEIADELEWLKDHLKRNPAMYAVAENARQP